MQKKGQIEDLAQKASHQAAEKFVPVVPAEESKNVLVAPAMEEQKGEAEATPGQAEEKTTPGANGGTLDADMVEDAMNAPDISNHAQRKGSSPKAKESPFKTASQVMKSPAEFSDYKGGMGGMGDHLDEREETPVADTTT